MGPISKSYDMTMTISMGYSEEQIDVYVEYSSVYIGKIHGADKHHVDIMGIKAKIKNNWVDMSIFGVLLSNKFWSGIESELLELEQIECAQRRRMI